MPKIAFASVGCKLNRYEIQVMSESLQAHGFETVSFAATADCYVINTCTVTSDAETTSRQFIRRAKRRNPEAKIIVTGCYAQLRPYELRVLGIDAIVSNRDKDTLPQIARKILGLDHSTPNNCSDNYKPRLISHMGSLTRAFVKIQDGCDERCTFCTIWIARGTPNSRSSAHITQEINGLSQNRYKEVVLTGVHIGKYKRDGLDFVGLLEKLLVETSVERIRLSSLNPLEIDIRLIELLSNSSRICPHLHLSIQSGDDDILGIMGRKYSRQAAFGVISRVKSSVPNITIGADFIVGFPGESNDNFENTLDLVRSSGIDYLHVFPFSDRPGTKASTMEKKVPIQIKLSRADLLRRPGQKKKQEQMERFIGKRLMVLVENRDSKKDEYMTGLSENYLRVDIPRRSEFKGMILEVVPQRVVDGKLITNVILGTASPKKELTF